MSVCSCITYAQCLRRQKRALDFLGQELPAAVNFCVRAGIQTWIFGMSRKCGFLLITGHQLIGHYIALIQNTTRRALIVFERLSNFLSNFANLAPSSAGLCQDHTENLLGVECPMAYSVPEFQILPQSSSQTT